MQKLKSDKFKINDIPKLNWNSKDYQSFTILIFKRQAKVKIIFTSSTSSFRFPLEVPQLRPISSWLTFLWWTSAWRVFLFCVIFRAKNLVFVYWPFSPFPLQFSASSFTAYHLCNSFTADGWHLFSILWPSQDISVGLRSCAPVILTKIAIQDASAMMSQDRILCSA